MCYLFLVLIENMKVETAKNRTFSLILLKYFDLEIIENYFLKILCFKDNVVYFKLTFLLDCENYKT